MASFNVSVSALTNSEDFKDEDFFLVDAMTLDDIVLVSDVADTCTEDGMLESESFLARLFLDGTFGATLALVVMVLSPLLVVEDDDDDDVPDDGSSSPAVSAVGRGGGEDESNGGGCCVADDNVSFELELGVGCAGPNLLSIAELISSRKKRLKSPLINSRSSSLWLSILLVALFTSL